MKPLDFVRTSNGPGVIYSVSKELKQAGVVLASDHKMHAYGLSFIEPLGYAPSFELKKILESVVALRKQVFGAP